MDSIKMTEKILLENCDKPQWGIVVADKQYPDKIWTTTNGSPILVGMNDMEIFVASESIAFKKEADCYFVTADGETLELEVDTIPELKKRMIQ